MCNNLYYDTYRQAIPIYAIFLIINITNNLKGGFYMILSAKAIYLSSEVKTSIKNKTDYNVICLMSGVDTINCMDKSIHDIYKFGQELDCQFDYNTQYKQISLVSSKINISLNSK